MIRSLEAVQLASSDYEGAGPFSTGPSAQSGLKSQTMKTRHTLLACIAALLSAGGAAAADPFTVFGLPLGGKVAPLPACPFNTDLAKTNCWIGKPFVDQGGERIGSVHLAKKDMLPGWAEHSMFKFTVTKKSVLEEITVETHDAYPLGEIVKSISARFGPPQQTSMNHRTSVANWSAPEVRIRMQCDTRCWVSFLTPDAQAKQDKEIEARKAANAARPVSP